MFQRACIKSGLATMGKPFTPIHLSTYSVPRCFSGCTAPVPGHLGLRLCMYAGGCACELAVNSGAGHAGIHHISLVSGTNGQ